MRLRGGLRFGCRSGGDDEYETLIPVTLTLPTASRRAQHWVNSAPRCSGHAGGMTDPMLLSPSGRGRNSAPSGVTSGAIPARISLMASMSITLKQRKVAVEQWLRQDVAIAYDAMKADPSRGRSLADVRASLAAAHEQASQTR